VQPYDVPAVLLKRSFMRVTCLHNTTRQNLISEIVLIHSAQSSLVIQAVLLLR
jgi:hypothetical protein